jgi:hypothetical protein
MRFMGMKTAICSNQGQHFTNFRLRHILLKEFTYRPVVAMHLVELASCVGPLYTP